MTQFARFGAGCFWGVQRKFDKVPGVLKTTVGYAQGKSQYNDPTYKQVCSGDTDHCEVIEIEYDPQQVSYGTLLNLFWSLHDPTQKDRQGPDYGRQYRTLIAYFNDEQKAQAEESKKQIQSNYSKPIQTVIEEAQKFYPAEEYHQKYLEKNEGAYCHI